MLVAALASLALAISGGVALADPPEDHRFCPNNRDWVIFPSTLSLEKDKNGDGFVCTKLDGEPSKDNNNPPNEEDDVLDNEFEFLNLLDG
jgi:hypothetical protein